MDQKNHHFRISNDFKVTRYFIWNNFETGFIEFIYLAISRKKFED